jgi:hypothetical protein
MRCLHGMLGIPELPPLILNVVFIFDLHGTHAVQCMYRQLMISECPPLSASELSVLEI